MSHTGISGDARRLLRASALTLILYLALGLAATVLIPYVQDAGFPSGLPSRGETGRTDYPVLRLSLARPGSPTRRETEKPLIAGGQNSTIQCADVDPLSTVGAAPATSGTNAPIGDSRPSDGDGQRQIAETGDAILGGSDGQRAGEAGMGAGSAPEAARFSSWLEGAIRERLLYPERARKRGQEGSVLIELRTDADGQSGSAILLRSSGHAVLDRAALDLARTIFPAPVRPGHPWSRQIELVYRLDSASPLPKLTK